MILIIQAHLPILVWWIQVAAKAATVGLKHSNASSTPARNMGWHQGCWFQIFAIFWDVSADGMFPAKAAASFAI